MTDDIRVLCVGEDGSDSPAAGDLERRDDQFAVVTERRAAEALDRLGGSGFDCVVSGYELPGADGVDFLGAVRETHPQLPFILFTAQGSEAVAGEAIDAGVTEYVRKQQGHGALADRIRDAVRQSRSERRSRRDTLEALHRVATSIQTEGTVEDVCERTVAAAADVLDFALCSLMIRDGEWLVPYATSEDAPEDASRRMRIDQGLAGKTHQTDTAQVVDEVREDDETDPAKEFYRSAISVPVGDRGVFQAVSTEPSAFDSGDVELAELLVSHAGGAIDRIERERELEQQNERLGEFASVVSHDLRNPLNVASGRLAMVREECDSPHVDVIARQHRRMEQLIDDLLALAREGQAGVEFEPVALDALARASWRGLAAEGASLVAATDAVVRADPDCLRQLLKNLFRNAIDHGGDDVTVTVGLLEDRPGFYVADDGHGVPEEDREQVFDHGYSTSDRGTGFGLSIVSRIADAHGWDVTVAASDDGGAQFEVTGVDVRPAESGA